MRSHSSHGRSSECGGMIVMLFIFVAIFAALSYAVSSGMRLGSGTSGAVSEEKMKLAFSEIHSVVEAHRIAIQNMLLNGISIDAIDASDWPDQNYYGWANTDCTSDACKLYVPGGGGLKFYDFANQHPDLAGAPQTPAFPTFPTALLWMWIAGQGTTQADMLFTINVTKDFCNFINKQLGITVDVDSTGVIVNTGQTLVANERAGIGDQAHAAANMAPGSGYAEHLAGQTEGCFVWKYSGGNPNSYRYFAILKAM